MSKYPLSTVPSGQNPACPPKDRFRDNRAKKSEKLNSKQNQSFKISCVGQAIESANIPYRHSRSLSDGKAMKDRVLPCSYYVLSAPVPSAGG